MGSLAVQVIIAGFATFMLFFKNTFRKIFYKDKKTANQEEEKENLNS